MTAQITSDLIASWACKFIGRTMSLPHGMGTIQVTGYKLGGRGKGAWFLGNKLDGSGHGETYRKFPRKKFYL